MIKPAVSITLLSALLSLLSLNQIQCQTDVSLKRSVPSEIMEEIYNQIKTPYKFGVVFRHPDSTKLIDSPTIFRENNMWFMTYIIYDGQGYETWLAESSNLTDWKSKGRILSFTPDSWDANQKAGYVSLVNYIWGGDYSVEKYHDKYWMSYLGGNIKGYESGDLGIGIASSNTLTDALEWSRLEKPVMHPKDKDARWFENKAIYKSLVIHDLRKLTGYPFVMYYNAKGDTADYESIGMAVSDNMVQWKRYGDDPVISRHRGICGDAQIARINDIYVMFYFGAFWKRRAFESGRVIALATSKRLP